VETSHPKILGRGTATQPDNRFETFKTGDNLFEGFPDEDRPNPKTQILKDSSRTILTSNDSPDVGFTYSVNPYRGCEHGCIYCYARPTHEYLGFSAGLDFETKIIIKENAAELLREKLMAKSWKPETIMMSGITDCYQPLERKLELTRSCLKVLAEFRNPVALITKNYLITRDIDLLRELHRFEAVHVSISVTTLKSDIWQVLEPRTAHPELRLKAIREISSAGIPVSAMLAPMIPGLTDMEMPAILKAVAEAGASGAGYVPVRLPYGVKNLFEDWLETHFPNRKEKVLARIRSLRGGKLNDSNFGSRMQGEGVFAKQLSDVFRIFTRKFGLDQAHKPLSTNSFRRPSAQKNLFDR
jgi:DNA repair photolyase